MRACCRGFGRASRLVAVALALLTLEAATVRADCVLHQGHKRLERDSVATWCIELHHIAGGSGETLVLKASFDRGDENRPSGFFLVDGKTVGTFADAEYNPIYWLSRDLHEGDVLEVGIGVTGRAADLTRFAASVNPLSVSRRGEAKDVTECPAVVDCPGPVKCPECGRRFSERGYIYCPYCGVALSEADGPR